MDVQDLEPFARYLEQLNDDPVRVAVLAAHNFIEETIEGVITQAVPNSECFDIPSMRFSDKMKILRALDPTIVNTKIWPVLWALNKLRNAAAHGDYGKLRDERFAALATNLPAHTGEPDLEALLRSAAAFCFGGAFINTTRISRSPSFVAGVHATPCSMKLPNPRS
jgi:hypothetical protein